MFLILAALTAANVPVLRAPAIAVATCAAMVDVAGSVVVATMGVAAAIMAVGPVMVDVAGSVVVVMAAVVAVDVTGGLAEAVACK